jgi:hypothetical protein
LVDNALAFALAKPSVLASPYLARAKRGRKFFFNFFLNENDYHLKFLYKVSLRSVMETKLRFEKARAILQEKAR